MRILVAGATGAIGARLVPALVTNGHAVAAMTRSSSKTERLRAAGAEPIVVDALDRDAVVEAIVRSAPDAVVHQLTALSGPADLRRFDRYFAATNRLRTTGTDHLLGGARAAGSRIFVAQSYGGWPYEREGGPIKSEDDPLDPAPPEPMRETLDDMRYLERVVTEADDVTGVVLRYGAFYGPGTSISIGGEIVEAVRRRRMPIVGGGAGVWSFVHVDDAAGATVAAIETGSRGVFNIVDDEPAPIAEWLPELARAIDAKPPRHLPAWLARPAIGETGVSLMTRIRGASNAKARRELGWRLRHPSWRTGFREGLVEPPGAIAA